MNGMELAAGTLPRSCRRLARHLILLAVTLCAACARPDAPAADDAVAKGAVADEAPAPTPERWGVILQYHFVDTDTPRSTSVSPAEFRAHIEHLLEQRIPVVPLPRLLDALRGGGELAPGSVAITFDDAYRSVHEHAFPLLREHGLPFTVFVNTDPVDAGNRAFTSWAQLAEMQAAGATIANHSASHAYLVRGDRLDDDAFDALLEHEVEDAEARIEAELGVSHRLFAYPFGEYDHRLRRWLDEHGYLAIGQQSGAVWAGTDFLAVPRFPFSGAYAELTDFADKIRMRPLPVLQPDTLPEPTLASRDARPELVFTLPDGPMRIAELACYASGQGRIPATVTPADDGTVRVTVRASQPLTAGRSRYNCTAPGDGAWYWFSQAWLRDIGPGTPP